MGQSTAEEDAAGSESEAEPESGPKAEPWPVVTLDKTWEEHYRLMLISIYPLVSLPVWRDVLLTSFVLI